MKKIVSLLLAMLLVTTCFPFVSNAMTLDTYKSKYQSLINDGVHSNGKTWNDDTMCKNASWKAWGCCSYVHDFAKCVYNVDSTFNNYRKYTSDASLIQTGDIVYGWNQWGEHWFVVLERDGGKLYTAEGNWSDAVSISSTRYTISGSKLSYYSYNKNNDFSVSQIFHFEDISGTHTVHSYDTYVYYWSSHPHYKCYQCSCGDIKENTNEPTYIDTCEACVTNKYRPATPSISVTPGNDKEATIFTYTNGANTDWNEYYLYDSSGAQIDFVTMIYNATIGVNLAPGTYTVKPVAINAELLKRGYNWYTFGSVVTFTVNSNGSINVINEGTYNGNRYQVISNKMTWEDAEKYCESVGGHLVTIRNQNEQNFINSIASGDYWIGYTDKNTEGSFEWVTGESSGYTNWISPEPNNTNGCENYTHISTYGYWNDNSEFVAYGFICEFENNRIVFEPNGGEYNNETVLTVPVNSFNEFRDVGFVTVFNEEKYSKSPANKYGYEFGIDSSGKVVDFRDNWVEESLYVPHGGFVLSCHSEFGDYIKSILLSESTSKVEFDKASMTVRIHFDGAIDYAPVGSEYTINSTPTSEDGTFIGWATTSDATEPEYVNGDTITLSENKTLYAVWRESDFTYIVMPDGTAEITGYEGTDTDIVIPNKIDGYTVTSIGNSAFAGCSKLTSISIPEGVTSIGNFAFENCIALTNINIPYSVTSIGEWAFYECSGLESVVISEGVKSICKCAFYHCDKLTSIDIPASVTSIGEDPFLYCTGLESISVNSKNTAYNSRNSCNAIIETKTNTLIVGCKNTVIPAGVKCIGDNAFLSCTGLKKINIPNSVTSIGNGAFFECTGLSSITIPESVTSIGYLSFARCSGFINVTIPDSVISIGHSAFANCTGLTSINIPDSVTSIGNGTFNSCTELTSINIPDSITSIDDFAFNFCNSLKDVYYNNTEAKWNSITIGNYNDCLLNATIHFVDECDVNDHAWDNGVVSAAATCTNDGIITYTCSKCGETKTESIKAPGHEFAYGVCKKCGAFSPEVDEDSGNVDSFAAVIYTAGIYSAPGQTVSVDVSMDTKVGINSYSLSIEYDKDVLTLDSVVPNSDLGGQFVFAKKAMWFSGEESTVRGTVFTLNFTVNSEADAGYYGIRVGCGSGDYISNLDGMINSTASIPGGVAVIEMVILPGDINGDGEVNSRDSRLLKQYISGTITEEDFCYENSDVNGDGEYGDSKDSRALKKLIVS